VTGRDEAALREELAREEALIAELDKRRDEAGARAKALREELAALPAIVASPRRLPIAGAPVPSTPAEKVKVFRSLFRGREDVFPTRFVAKKTGRAGYAPECANKFVRGVCELPKIKCSDCTNQAFRSVNDTVIADHLRGHHVAGVYPLLADETCWFLAADFDKASWKEDVAALVETCGALGLAAAVERSRSGDGAHVWFFFSAPVAARVARKLGVYLLTETMNRRHQLGMGSYDRLFPNQDSMPRGGFGNLIALPLQAEPRKSGNSVFIDERFEPYPDQWAFLASVVRMEPASVEEIVSKAARRGQNIGPPLADGTDEEDAPWLRPPSGRRAFAPIPGPLPAMIHAVLAQRLFVEKAGFPPRCSIRSSGLPPSVIPSFSRSRACASRRRPRRT
jgi:hypothetical protein